jgi:hypothetical protein
MTINQWFRCIKVWGPQRQIGDGAHANDELQKRSGPSVSVDADAASSTVTRRLCRYLTLPPVATRSSGISPGQPLRAGRRSRIDANSSDFVRPKKAGRQSTNGRKPQSDEKNSIRGHPSSMYTKAFALFFSPEMHGFIIDSVALPLVSPHRHSRHA